MTDDSPQSNPDAAVAKPQLVAENEHYSVRILDLTGATRMALPQRTNDTIVVVLGQGLSLISDRLESPVALADGDVRFLERIKHPSAGSFGRNCVASAARRNQAPLEC